MMSSDLFISVFWMLLITKGLQTSTALTELLTGPCEEELSRSQNYEGAFQPQCTPYGSYEEKQCNTTHCWCVDQCGEVLPGTYGDFAIRCEEQPAPCLQEYMRSHAIQPVFGVFRPRCRSDGFYYHTQCLGTNCFCYDRCGHTVPGSDHHVSRVREFLCACPNDDHAYNCPTNPCEGAVCDLYPDAICKASICGECKAEFYVDGDTVQCVGPAKLESCTDSNGAIYPINAEFEQDCQICTCTTLGEISCLDMPCPPPTEDPPEGCQYLTPPGGCCRTRVFCMKPLSDCPPNTPVAMCGSNECLTATCEAYPDAICSVGFCGSTACKAFFYDKDQNEVDCEGNDASGNGIRVPEELINQPATIIPSTPTLTCPGITCSNACSSSARKVIAGCQTCECVDAVQTTTSPAPPTTYPPCPYAVTCSNRCGPSGRKWINGCRTCECVDAPTTTYLPCPYAVRCSTRCGPSGYKYIKGCQTCDCVDAPTTTTAPPTTIPPCPPVTCSHFCGPSGLKRVHGCEVCECAKPVIRTTTTTTTPPSTVSPCPTITCGNACGSSGRKVIHGCRSCECVDEPPVSTTVPTGCLDPEGLFHAAGSNWHSDACTHCFCTDAGYITCAQKYCAMPPPYCGIDPVQDPEDCCPSFTCPDSCTDSSGNVRAINEEYLEECQTCTCTPYGEPSCQPNPCPPHADDPPARCQFVTPPGSCCPTRLACMESEFNCIGPVAMCLYNTCLDAICEAYPDAKCSISFCGLKACQAVFYDENDQELDCVNSINKGCVDETSGKIYKVGEFYNDGCNDCTCMEDGGFACTEKACGCVEESTGIFYKTGDSFNDGCNDCMCKEGGFACTKKFCKPEESEPLSMCDPWNVQTGFLTSRPRCRPDGSYSPKQCSEDGSCWCVDDMGDRVKRSLRLDGSSVQCEIDPPCQMEVAINQRRAVQDEPLTSDPICDKDGFYEIEQCDPETNKCWCSEKDGTVVLGSYKTNREDLKCSKVCFGEIPLLLSKCSYHSGCPEGYSCHMERCCRVRITEP